MTWSLEVEDGADVAKRQVGMDVDGALEHESMVAIAGVRVVFRKPLVHEQREVELTSDREGDVECRVLVSPQGVVHPVENIVATGPRRRRPRPDPFTQ